MKNSKKTAVILMTILVIMWGFEYVGVKDIQQYLNNWQIIFLKNLTGFIFTLILALAMKENLKVDRKDIKYFVLCSLTGVILYYTCEYEAIRHIKVACVSVILAFVPIISLLVERVLYKRKLSGKLAAGILVSIAGASLTIGGGLKDIKGGDVAGYILAFLAGVCWVCFNFISAGLTRKYSSLVISTVQLGCTSLILLPYALISLHPLNEYGQDVWLWILFLGAGCCCFGYIAMMIGLKTIGPTLVGMFSNFLPFSSALCAWVCLGQELTLVQIAGAVIVVAASCYVMAVKGKIA